MRVLLGVVYVSTLGVGLGAAACGGATAGNLAAGDSGTDGAGGGGEAGGGGSSGGSSGGDAGASPADAAAPCAPPADPNKAALCLTVAPEPIDFSSDTRFDGKGYLVAQVFGTPLPDSPDGGEVAALAAQTFGAPGAGGVDLSQPLPVIRFDGLSGTVYPRVVFADDPALGSNIGPGTWLAGYDLGAGLGSAPPLVARPLVAGTGTSITVKLSALRELVVTMERTTPAVGNGQGAATFVATTDQVPASGSPLFGLGQAACAHVDGANTAQVSGFVIGAGPYYVAGVLDDFGLADGGVSLPPGALTSLQVTSAGPEIPAADRLTYAPTAYRVSQTIALDSGDPRSARVRRGELSLSPRRACRSAVGPRSLPGR